MNPIVMGLPAQVADLLLIADQGHETPCLLWTGTRSANGYGVTTLRRKQYKVHRLAYEAANGPFPPGLVTDHLCRVKECANPSHLEAVTDAVNVMRGVSFATTNAAKTHCLRGHEFTPENTVRDNRGHRACRECRRIRGRVQDRKRQAARVSARRATEEFKAKEKRQKQREDDRELARARRAVDPMLLGMPTRMLAKVMIEDRGMAAPCLIWTGAHNGRGYGQMGAFRSRSLVYVHRVAWEAQVGPIPRNVDIKNSCGTRSCIGIDHLYGSHRSARSPDQPATKETP